MPPCEKLYGWMAICHTLVSRKEKGSEMAEVGVSRKDPADQSGECHQISYLCREPAEEGIPEVHQGEGKVFVKEVAEKLAHAIVGPSAMDQE